MSNITITNIDTGNVILQNAQFTDGTFTAAGAGTTLAGTILAKLDASGKYQVWESAGTLGVEIPKAVLTYDVVAAGAGDLPVRAMIAGSVRQERLIEAGNAAGVGIDGVVVDQLSDYNIAAISVSELNILDNQ